MTVASALPIAWTIAGSDSGGGAGIQADLASFRDFGVHGCSVITALTAQNSVGVSRVTVTPVEQVRAELAALAEDLPPRAIKTGMLPDAQIVSAVVEALARHDGPVICDPVMVATSGDSLLGEDGDAGVFAALLAHTDLVTPNLAEAQALTGLAARNRAEIEMVAAKLLTTGVGGLLITGGHLDAGDGGAWDYFTDGTRSWWLRGERVAGDNTHGSGCTLSSAIAAALARGYSLEDALVLAKAYVSAGIRHASRPGRGPGPVAHTGFPHELADLPMVISGDPERWRPRRFPDCGGRPLGLYPVVDSAEWVERLVDMGVDTIQLRIKNLAEQPLRIEIERAVAAARRTGARLFINDYWQVAIEAGAYGVHLGQEDLDTADIDAIEAAGLRLGISTHSFHEIARAHALAPSYIAIGPIYSTTTKEMRFAPQGLEQLKQWVELLQPRYPLTAIGGIDADRAPGVLATGVGSIALVRAITAVDDYREATTRLQRIVADHS